MNIDKCPRAVDSTSPPDLDHIAICADCAEAWCANLLRNRQSPIQIPSDLPSASLLWLRGQLENRALREEGVSRFILLGDWVAILSGILGLTQVARLIW